MKIRRDPEEQAVLELDVEPTVLGRVGRLAAKVRLLREQVEAAREGHERVDLALTLIERDSTIGGGMLGGALAYRLFVFLLPLALFLDAWPDLTTPEKRRLLHGFLDRIVLRRAGARGRLAPPINTRAEIVVRGGVSLP